MKYIAHIRESDMAVQSVEGHSWGVKELAEKYGEKIGVKHIAGLAGMLHDMGKFTEQFQEYILEAVQNPDAPPRRGSVDHSTAGGRLLYEWYHNGSPSAKEWALAEIVGNAVISHHSYLHDFLSGKLESPYLYRVHDKECPGYKEAKRLFFEKVMDEKSFRRYVNAALTELDHYLAKPSPERTESKVMYLTKYVFSALIDADRTDTRRFEENVREGDKPGAAELFQAYYDKLMSKIETFQAEDSNEAKIHWWRRKMSDDCEAFAKNPPEIYTLSIPTGGGKTLASFRYALRHALEHGLERIIYVVPYTTIIEQNAKELRRTIQDDEHLLEYHSNVVEDNEDDEHLEGRFSIRQKLNLAKDNWEAPIVMTTLVQFLNVFYAKGSRNIRKLHNLSNSVVIFDEVQKVPIHCVALFNHAVNFLKTYARSSIVLCTATQPALDFVKHRLDLKKDSEMVTHLEDVTKAFERVEMIDRVSDGPYTTDILADFIGERLKEVRSALVVLNTKTAVKRLYERVTGFGAPVFHLSTSMCPAHRHDILEKVKVLLENRDPVLCISTQLIEAGVDISFDCVVRSLAGLDSVAQAAGRCNRHGRNGIQKVYVIDHAEERLDRLPEIQKGKEISRKILADLRRDRTHHGGHMLSPQALKRYFQELYTDFESSLSYPVTESGKRTDIVSLLMANRGDEKQFHQNYKQQHRKALPLAITNSYRTAAEHFEVIQDFTQTVLVPYGDRGKEIIARLNGNESIENLSQLLREAQQYSVNLYKQERDHLSRNGGIVSLMGGEILALRDGAYSEEYGVNIENDGSLGIAMWG